MVRLWIFLWKRVGPIHRPRTFHPWHCWGHCAVYIIFVIYHPKSTINHQLQVCQASCMIHFLSTRRKWTVFSAIYASKYRKQQINTMFTNFLLIQQTIMIRVINVHLRPKRMICPRPCGMAPREAKKRGRRAEFGYLWIDVIFMCVTSVNDRGPSQTQNPKPKNVNPKTQTINPEP